MFKQFFRLILNIIPIGLMIGLIPCVEDDYMLTAVFVAIIVLAFVIKKERKEVKLFFIGGLIMIGAEYLFISTGVETFERNSLLGLMPLWLPVLWGYCFVVMKRFIKIFNF